LLSVIFSGVELHPRGLETVGVVVLRINLEHAQVFWYDFYIYIFDLWLSNIDLDKLG
jgi:hypothetical protein